MLPVCYLEFINPLQGQDNTQSQDLMQPVLYNWLMSDKRAPAHYL